ncbi:hypothetical protein [Streptomyces sp. NRRL B-24484]|uniref:hypothetical protein n=1 Tax=Streptomyces sp. NRRL B-24484 TaxID=1463833 RepID=UPI0004C0EEC5|nr:hypothetical protein [Streptomyces sp. NRRL B-24484]
MAFGPVVQQRARGGGLTAIGVLMLVQLASELGVLAYDVTQKGPGYLLTALGVSYADYVDAPVGFFGYDTGLCVALAVLAVGAFTGGRWVRPAAVALTSVTAFASLGQVLNQVVHSASRRTFAEPVSHLWLNMTLLLTIGIAIAVAAIVGATRPTAPAAPAPVAFHPYVPAQRQAHPPIPPTTPPGPPPAPPAPPNA